MALTIGGGLKVYIEAAGLGLQVFKDSPPERAVLRNPKPPAGDGLLKAPYCTYLEDIVPLRLDPTEDGGPANGGTATGRQTFQLDLWQNWRDTNDKNLESPTLADALTRALDGARLPAAPMLVYAVKQAGRVRLLEREIRLVHHAYTLIIARVI